MPDQKEHPALLKTRAERIGYAILELEKTTLGKVEKALGWSAGDLSKYVSGKRGATTVDVDKMKALARHLHVEFLWLVSGDGPVRRGGRGSTPFEEAMGLARLSETPEEAIQSAWERHKDRAGEMSALEWAAMIHAEEQILLRRAAQRGETMETGVHPPRVDRQPRPVPPPKRLPR